MGTIRKLKKSIDKHEESKLPALLIVPSDTFDPSGKDLVTITDSKIYYKILDGAMWALENKRAGVTRSPNDMAESKPKIIVSGGIIK